MWYSAHSVHRDLQECTCLYLRPSGSRRTNDNGPDELYVFVFSEQKKAVKRAAALQQTAPARATEQGDEREKTFIDIATLKNEKNVQKKADKVFAKILGGQRNDKGKKMCSPEHLTVKKTSSAQESVRRQKESWAARLSSTFASSPSVEKMRCKN